MLTLLIGTKETFQFTPIEVDPEFDLRVKIELSRDNGSSWEVLDSSAANTGLYDWIPTGPETTQGLIKISGTLYTDPIDGTETDFSDIYDISDNNFSILTDAPANSFDLPPEKSLPVNSSVNLSKIIRILGTDNYFDSSLKFSRVDITYQHENLRQKKVVVHMAPLFQSTVTWTSNAQSGLWRKVKIRARDTDGAEIYLYRDQIGETEDFTLT